MLLVLALGATTADGRQQQAFKIQVQTQLVVETVSVRDKDGKTIEGLTEKDFVVTEDGVPQTISVFRFERMDNTPLAATAERFVPHAAGVQPAVSQRPIASSARFQDRRLLVLFFYSGGDRAYLEAARFIQSQMKAADLITIMRFSRGVVSVLQDFTDDREVLLETLWKLLYTEEYNEYDLTVSFGQESPEFNLFNTDRQLAALQTAVNMLRSVNERKSLVYFAGGLQLNGLDNMAQLRATINAAIRANVTIFPVDSRGLVAMAPMGDASRPSPGGLAMFTGAFTMSRLSAFQQSQDTLYALAEDTGGKAMLDSNDLAAGIVQAQQAITSYYVIGYYPTNTAPDGKFRRVKISLKEIQNAKLDYRQGYYAAKTFDKFTVADKERQLEEALMLEDPITDLTIATEINYFQLNSAEYFVPITVKIPGSELVLARKEGAERTLIDFIGVVKIDPGPTVRNLRDKVEVKLSGETASALQNRPIQYDTGFTLLPGKYVLKFLARNAETGRIGTYQTSFAVPNLMKEESSIPISSVVLGSQRVDLKEALYTAGKGKLAAAARELNPLVVEGQKLLPSVTRVFSRERDMYVYLQAYEHYAASPQPLVAYITFYRGEAKAFETPMLQFEGGLDPNSKALSMRFSISLSKLPPGEYLCQVTVLDPASQKASFWQAPIMLIP